MMQDDTAGAPYARRVFYVLLGVIGVVTVVHLLLQFLNLEVFWQQNGAIYELSNRFDLDDEHSVPTWVSQLLLLIASVGAYLVSRAERNRLARRMWTVLAVILAALSIDEVSGLHEYTLQVIHVAVFQDESPTLLANAWWIVLPVIAVAAVWFLWRLAAVVPRRTVAWFALSGVLYAIGAIAVDAVTSSVGRETFLNQGVLVAIEESLELIGSAVVVYAIAEYAERYHPVLASRLVRFVSLKR